MPAEPIEQNTLPKRMRVAAVARLARLQHETRGAEGYTSGQAARRGQPAAARRQQEARAAGRRRQAKAGARLRALTG